MSDLKLVERVKLEKILGMGDGYVLNFSDRTFREFVAESVGLDIFDEKYRVGSGSKANCLRGFWKVESNAVVAKLLRELLGYRRENSLTPEHDSLIDEYDQICARLSRALPEDGPATSAEALPRPSSSAEVVTPFVRQTERAGDYDVCLSFAGEDRAYVEEVARMLVESGLRVFYDKYEQVTLWGKDLYQHLDKVYRSSAAYCVVFASSSYATKLWTKHELRSAQARAFQENREYILPVRFDDTEIPGILPTIGYIDLRQTSPQALAAFLVRKIRPNPVHDATVPVPTTATKTGEVDTSKASESLLRPNLRRANLVRPNRAGT